MRRLMVIVAFLSIVGCAAPYKEPTVGNIAKLTVPNLGSGGLYDIGDVRIASAGNDGCGKFAIVPKEDSKKKNMTLNIQANKEIFIELSKVSGRSACIISGWFTPNENRNYKASFGLGTEKCFMIIQETFESGKVDNIELHHAFISRRDGVTTCKNSYDL